MCTCLAPSTLYKLLDNEGSDGVCCISLVGVRLDHNAAIYDGLMLLLMLVLVRWVDGMALHNISGPECHADECLTMSELTINDFAMDCATSEDVGERRSISVCTRSDCAPVLD